MLGVVHNATLWSLQLNTGTTFAKEHWGAVCLFVYQGRDLVHILNANGGGPFYPAARDWSM